MSEAAKAPKGVIERFNKLFTVPLAKSLGKYDFITPNKVTVASAVVGCLAAPFIYFKQYIISAILIIIGAFLDSLDGDIAREKGMSSRKGALLDAVLDRYVDIIILSALLLSTREYFIGLAAILGSAIVPYVRARAEAEGLVAARTIGSRDTRNLVLFLGLLFQRPVLTLAVIAVIGNVSGIHRIYVALKENGK